MGCDQLMHWPVPTVAPLRRLSTTNPNPDINHNHNPNFAHFCTDIGNPEVAVDSPIGRCINQSHHIEGHSRSLTPFSYIWCVIITGTPNFQGQNLVNMRFICTKIFGPRQEMMLREVLPELSIICTAFTV